MQENRFLVPFAIVVAGTLIAGAIYFGASTPATYQPGQVKTEDIDIAPVTDDDHFRGSRDAELVIVEYSDTECPFCKVFHNTMVEVLRSYPGQVAWVYRHFPIPQLHAKASKEAEATECAAELGGNQSFWNYLDKIFETTDSNDSLDPAQLPIIASSIGLDETAFNACLSSGRYTEFVADSIEAAVKAGARGTPYSIIIAKDGTKTLINGAEPLSSVKAKIDSLLK